MTGDRPPPAGKFSEWMVEIREAIAGERTAEVPCYGCTACCTSSQFIHIGPDETETLARIPQALLFPAPRLPRGHVLLGYDNRGHCPMLIDNRCSIYEHRPRTCRTYDCRVFPATGVEAGHPLIAERARRWRFTSPSEADRIRHAAARAAAAFLREHADLLPAGTVPANATQLAVLAIDIHELFLGRDEATGETTVLNSDPAAVQAAILSRPAARRLGPSVGGSVGR